MHGVTDGIHLVTQKVASGHLVGLLPMVTSKEIDMELDGLHLVMVDISLLIVLHTITVLVYTTLLLEFLMVSVYTDTIMIVAMVTQYVQ